ncbi:pilus assembly protein [Salinicoccus sp. ID82-1]|uniref:Pilus assembly protein n=1 Tax=Salinicoccus cyprini TaxID=2493691 RepID=A0A558ASY0_9STAP|nr:MULTISPECIES: TadE/TadG family type IV pilus assembly protein [Salinicoccus]MCG1009771.1 pilus assembly protein [Salinicoccus sp. ID82-1]TVT27361.1 pilus assembly protein [Salinicoccus cyprini]
MIKKEDGQSLVEFAILVPLVFALLIGIVDFGRVIHSQLQLELVTQDAARMAGLGESDEMVKSYALDNFVSGDSSKLDVTVSPSGEKDSGTYVTVEMTYPESIFNMFGDYSIPFTVNTSSTTRVE